METGNLLNQGVETLYEIKNTLEKLDGLRSNCVLLDNDIKRAERDLTVIKNKCSLEIENSVCVERTKIKTSYDEKNNLLKSRLKRTQNERKEEKKQKIDQKIEANTGDIKEKIKRKEETIKNLYENCNTPRLLNNALCNSIFMPQSVGDYVVMLLVILGLLAIPLAFYPLLVAKFLPLTSKKPFIIAFVCLFLYIIGYGILNSNGRLRLSKVVDEMIDLFAIHIPRMVFPFCCMVDLMVLIFSPEDQQGIPLMVLIYFVIIKIIWLIYKGIKGKWYKIDSEVIQKVKNERNQIKILKKLIKKEKQLIKNDKDEEYGLKDFDWEIESLQLQIEKNKEEKKNSLAIFENETKPEISGNISEKYAASIKEFESKIEGIRSEKNIVDAEYDQVLLKISKEYEVFLGKENLSLKTIDSLISIIENKNANNIAEALNFYRTINMQNVQHL